MKTNTDKAQENKSPAIANHIAQQPAAAAFQLVDMRPEAIAQKHLLEMANNSP